MEFDRNYGQADSSRAKVAIFRNDFQSTRIIIEMSAIFCNGFV